MKIHSYKDLDLWQKGMELVKGVYQVTQDFPDTERYGLTMQIRRAAVSVPSNVAEGFRRQHNKEFRQFLHIALGSCAELETQLLLAHEIGYLDAPEKTLDLMDHISRMARNLIKKL